MENEVKVVSQEDCISFLVSKINAMGVESLAKEMSRFSENKILVVENGVSLSTVNSLKSLVEDDSFTISDVYLDGLPFAYLDGNGEAVEFGDRFNQKEKVTEADSGTFETHMTVGDLTTIYDENKADVICYAKSEYASAVESALNGINSFDAFVEGKEGNVHFRLDNKTISVRSSVTAIVALPDNKHIRVTLSKEGIQVSCSNDGKEVGTANISYANRFDSIAYGCRID